MHSFPITFTNTRLGLSHRNNDYRRTSSLQLRDACDEDAAKAAELRDQGKAHMEVCKTVNELGLPTIIQIIEGESEPTAGDQAVAGKPGTRIQMKSKTPHSIKAQTPVVMLLTLFKTGSQ